MREIKDLYTSFGSLRIRLFWCLFATTFTVVAVAAENVSESSVEKQDAKFAPVSIKQIESPDSGAEYNSSIQRSNFLALDPSYLFLLDSATSERRSQFIWKLRFDAQDLRTDQNIQSTMAGANFVGRFRYRLLDNLRFVAKANLNLEAGRTQSIFGDQEPGSAIYPRAAYIEYLPIKDYTSLKVGLIQQRWFNEQIFISKLAFIGLSEQAQVSNRRFALGARLQQLVPTSYTISTRVTDREDTPIFLSESIEAKAILSKWNFIQGRLTHYQYQNLPAVVAFESFIYGNTVTNTDVKNAEFIYEFNGWMSQLGFEQKFSDSFAAQVQWNMFKNMKAPDDAGEAQAINLTLANDFGRWIVSGRYKNYFIESDAVPGAYNSHIFGHNNRIGQGYGLRLESKDWGIIFIGDYVRANLLNQSSRRIDGLQQDNQQTIYFAVETMYDFI